MENYLEYYRFADNLLKLINESEGGSIKRKRVHKDILAKRIPELLVANGLIFIVGEGEKQVLKITPEGEAHLSIGGFVKTLGIENPKESSISFRSHIEANTNLLTIFGILNALIIYASQGKTVDNTKLDLFNNGMQFISIGTYVLSIMVMIEILQNTLIIEDKNWKFSAFYLCIGSCTIGIGFVFLSNFGELIVTLGIAFAYLTTAAVITAILSVSKLLLPKVVREYFDDRKKIVQFIELSLGLIIAMQIFKYTAHLWK